MKKLIFIPLLFVISLACTKKDFTPRKVAFDRDVCFRCAMQINDPSFAAQAVHKESAAKVVFEELGCALVWLRPNRDNYTLYIADMDTGEFLNFDEAFFLAEYKTSMGYGVGAVKSRREAPEGKSFLSKEEVLERVYRIDEERKIKKHL